MDTVPCLAVDDGVVLAGIAPTLVDHLTDVGAVVQHPVEVLLVDPVAAWRAEAAPADLAGPQRAGANLDEAGEYPAHMCRGGFVNQQLPALDALAVRRHPAHPHALPPTGGALVADALGSHLALELRERE